MARPIEETPVLTGNDAKRFLKAMKAAEAGALRVSDEEMAKIRASFERLNAIARFK